MFFTEFVGGTKKNPQTTDNRSEKKRDMFLVFLSIIACLLGSVIFLYNDLESNEALPPVKMHEDISILTPAHNDSILVPFQQLDMDIRVLNEFATYFNPLSIRLQSRYLQSKCTIFRVYILPLILLQ
jgi:hypothetical protein